MLALGAASSVWQSSTLGPPVASCNRRVTSSAAAATCSLCRIRHTQHSASRFHGSGHGGFSGSCSFRIKRQPISRCKQRCLIRNSKRISRTQQGRSPGSCIRTFCRRNRSGQNSSRQHEQTGFTLSTRANPGERAADFRSRRRGADKPAVTLLCNVNAAQGWPTSRHAATGNGST